MLLLCIIIIINNKTKLIKMEFDKWIEQYKERRKIDSVQLRMISQGNDFACSQPKPRYGIYLLTEKEKDYDLLTPFQGRVFGGVAQPNIEFFVEDLPLFGYRAKREHGDEYRDRKVVGFGITRRGIDKKSYKKALKKAKEIASLENAGFQDLTAKDLRKYEDSASRLNLDKRVWKYRERIKS